MISSCDLHWTTWHSGQRCGVDQKLGFMVHQVSVERPAGPDASNNLETTGSIVVRPDKGTAASYTTSALIITRKSNPLAA
jgi:hypothetical protein